MPGRMDRLAENTAAKIIARYVMPPVVGLIGWLGVQMLTDLKQDMRELKTSQQKTREEVVSLSVKIDANRDRADAAVDVLRRTIGRVAAQVDSILGR